MNKRPIEESNDPDLIGSQVAMRRAADTAWRIARETSTMIVVEIDGEVVHVEPGTSREEFLSRQGQE